LEKAKTNGLFKLSGVKSTYESATLWCWKRCSFLQPVYEGWSWEKVSVWF